MSPSNKKKHSKNATKATKSTQPLANASPLDSGNHTPFLSDDNSSPASATRIAFQEFIQLADLDDVADFIDAAASTSDGGNLKLLWKRAFEEGLRVGRQLYVGAVNKLNEAHNGGYEEGYNEGRRDEQMDWIIDSQGLHGDQPPSCEDSSTQTEPPSLVDASASTSDTDTAINEPTPTPINPPPPTILVITVDSGTQTQNDDDSPPLLPVIPTAPVLKPPPKMEPHPPPLPSMQPLKPKPYKRQDLASEPHPQPSPAHFDWANDAASLPILPRNPPPRDLSVLRSSSQQPFSSLQRRNKKSKKHFSQPFRCHHSSSVPHQNFFQARYLPFRSSSAPFVPAPRSRSPSTLNWEDDPRLSDLSRALRALGWIRPPAARAPPW